MKKASLFFKGIEVVLEPVTEEPEESKVKWTVTVPKPRGWRIRLWIKVLIKVKIWWIKREWEFYIRIK